jgi:uncharacterized protein YeeX (DUF496 family)
MATTWIKSLHIGKKRARSSVVAGIIDYVNNPNKTDGGKLITSYACDSRVADDEFMLAKKEYEYITGRNQGSRDVLAYHIRQSFKPGEVDAETANRIGYELAMSFTKGNHAFVVATHIDKAHIHNHIIFNSTALTYDRKFNDFKRSGKVVRRISDLLCAENGLSVIENPKPSKGRNYADWLGNKEPSWQEKLRRKIDEVLPDCSTFEDFLAAMKAAGYNVNDKRKHITFLAPGQTKATRLNTLKGDHTEEAIRERLAGTRTSAASSGAGGGQVYQPVTGRVNLLIDIQAKIREGKGAGYERWARIFNLKEAARTVIFLKENGIDSYDDLVKKSSSASGDFAALNRKIKDAEKRMAEISELQKYIGQYGKTRDVYSQYIKSKRNADFYEEHRADITLHMAAKKYFDGLGYGKNKKLPTIASLKQEYAALLAEKKKLYSGYQGLKKNMQELAVARGNADKILGVRPETLTREDSRTANRSGTHEI